MPYKTVAKRKHDDEQRAKFLQHKADTYTMYRRVLGAIVGHGLPSIYTTDSAGSPETEYGYAYDSGYAVTVKVTQNHSDSSFVQVAVNSEQAEKLAEFLKTL